MSIRPMTESDTPAIESIVKSQKTMFGTNIIQYHDFFIKRIIDPSGLSVVGEISGEVLGVMRINLWNHLPFWNVGMNFTKNSGGLEYVKSRALSLSMYDYCMRYAEEDNRYDGYIAITDTGRNLKKRRNLHAELFPPITTRYDLTDVEIIQPFSTSKYEAFQWMLGSLAMKNVRPVIIRHSHLREEFRK